jgi:hypothetical protein
MDRFMCGWDDIASIKFIPLISNAQGGYTWVKGDRDDGSERDQQKITVTEHQAANRIRELLVPEEEVSGQRIRRW